MNNEKVFLMRDLIKLFGRPESTIRNWNGKARGMGFKGFSKKVKTDKSMRWELSQAELINWMEAKGVLLFSRVEYDEIMERIEKGL